MIIETRYEEEYLPQIDDFILAIKKAGGKEVKHVYKIKEMKFQEKEFIIFMGVTNLEKDHLIKECVPSREEDLKEGKTIKALLADLKKHYEIVIPVVEENVKMSFLLDNKYR